VLEKALEITQPVLSSHKPEGVLRKTESCQDHKLSSGRVRVRTHIFWCPFQEIFPVLEFLYVLVKKSSVLFILETTLERRKGKMPDNSHA
jgi:hypothetical protein